CGERMNQLIDSLPLAPSAQAVAADFLWQAAAATSLTDFLLEAWPLMLQVVPLEYIALVAATGGEWRIIGAAGQPRSLPIALLAEVLDRDCELTQDNWAAAPLSARSAQNELLAICLPRGATGSDPRAAVGSLAAL